jgi:hypothetical protein
MTATYLELLDGFLADPTDPRWSSATMDRMFADVEGTAKQKLSTVLERIDDRFAASSHSLTKVQTEFVRQVTLFAYTSRIASDLNADDLNWLVTRFRSAPSPQRALTIVLLIPFDELPPEINLAILNALRGTPGQRYLDPNVVADSEKT